MFILGRISWDQVHNATESGALEPMVLGASGFRLGHEYEMGNHNVVAGT